jgi:hypothetical protein
MIDPAALGTLVIGLDHVRAADESTDRPPAVRSIHANGDRRVTRALAASLRWLAEVIEPTPRPRDLGLES